MNLPTNKEWEAFGFKVPAELCSRESPVQIPNDADLCGVETYTPTAEVRQAAIDQAMTEYVTALESRIKRLEMAMVASQLYCRMNDSISAYGVLSSALSSL